jgi:hypothetical protein
VRFEENIGISPKVFESARRGVLACGFHLFYGGRYTAKSADNPGPQAT